MATICDLRRAVDKTQIKIPENTFFLIYSGIFSNNEEGYNYITSTDDERDKIRKIPKHEIVEILACELVRIHSYLQTKGIKKFIYPYYWRIKELVKYIKNDKINSILYFLNDNTNLIDLLAIIEEYHYGNNKKYRSELDGFEPDFKDTELINKISYDHKNVWGIRNVQVNPGAVNKCVMDIISGEQIRNGNNSYQVGNLFATQHVGKKRKNQQDSVLILEHPSNPDFKILVVSDGMGGGQDGEKVSRYTVLKIAEWFNRINPENFYHPDVLQEAFNLVINKISQDVYEHYNKDRFVAGATFTGAIVTKNQTIITQVGDSRAYIIKDDVFSGKSKLTLVTYDESVVWPKYENYQPRNPMTMDDETIDDLRFLYGSNRILRCIGDTTDANAQSIRIPNNCYDKLLLMTDGASDLLPLKIIKFICANTPLEKITDLLVFSAVNKKAARTEEGDELYKKLSNGTLSQEELDYYNNHVMGIGDEQHKAEIPAGKDNATVAGFFRR